MASHLRVRPAAHNPIIVPASALACALVVSCVTIFAGVYGFIVLASLLVAPLLITIDIAPLLLFVGFLPSIWQIDTGQLSATKMLGILCVVTWSLGVIIGRQSARFRVNLLDVCVLLLFALYFVSILTMSTNQPLSTLQVYGENLWLYFLARLATNSFQNLKTVLWVLVLGSDFAALLTVWQYFRGVSVFVEGINRLDLTGIGVNTLAAIFLCAGGVALGLGLRETRGAARLFLWGSTFLLFIAVVLSKSRGAFIGAVAMIIVGILLVPERRHRITLALTAMFGALAVIPGPAAALGLSDYSNRIQNALGDASLENSRVYLWKMAIAAMQQHPFTGLGVGNFVQPDTWAMLAFVVGTPLSVIGPEPAHSFLLGIAADVGVPGALLAGAALLLALYYLWRALGQAKREGNESALTVSYALALGFPAYFIAAEFIPVNDFSLPYILLGLVSGLGTATAFRASDIQLTVSVGRECPGKVSAAS